MGSVGSYYDVVLSRDSMDVTYETDFISKERVAQLKGEK